MRGRWRAAMRRIAPPLLCLLAACASRGFHHTVRPGENLYRIGKAYGVPHEALAKLNKIGDPSRIEVGQRLLIPGASRQLPVNTITPRDVAFKRAPDEPEIPPGKRPFIWPVKDAVVTSTFGPRGRTFHDGIDIAAPLGTEVVAAAEGEVVYADELRGYGRVIILRHGDGYATVYAHNRQNLVREGNRVRRAQVIATVGDTGRTSAPNLHFEVRRENTARNPLSYLPPIEPARLAATAGG